MGQNKKYTNEKLFYSTIASIFGHTTDLLQNPIEWTKWCFETSSCYSSNAWKTLKTHFNIFICKPYKCLEKCVSMGQHKKYTNKMFFYSTFLDTEQIL